MQRTFTITKDGFDGTWAVANWKGREIFLPRGRLEAITGQKSYPYKLVVTDRSLPADVMIVAPPARRYAVVLILSWKGDGLKLGCAAGARRWLGKLVPKSGHVKLVKLLVRHAL